MKRSLLLAASLAAAPACRAYDLIEPLPPFPVGGRPVAVAAGGGRVYALDGEKSALHIFDASGNLLKTVGGPGAERGRFDAPRGLAVDGEGRLAVADSGNNRVQVLDSDGNFLASFGGKGSEPGRMRGPASVAFGAYGRVFVADTGNARVQAFTQDGVFLFAFGIKGNQAGQLKEPIRVAVDRSDHLYVLDRGNEKLLKFDPGMRLVRETPLEALDVDVDEYGFLYALEAGSGKVQEYGPDGRLLGGFGSEGTGPGQYRKPQGVCAGADGVVLVADTGNGRVQRVRLRSKLKTEPLPPDRATRLLVSPATAWNYQASALSAASGRIIAYLPKPRRFVSIGEDGKELGRFGASAGKAESETKGTRGLAASEKHGLYVADTDGGRVQSFVLTGEFRGAFGQVQGAFDSAKKDGRVRTPSGMAINEAGTVYVADEGNRRVSAFGPDGSFLFSFGPKVGSLELEKPCGVAFDPAGSLYLLDAGLKKVLKLEPSGGFVAAWGEAGSAPGAFSDPVAIAFDGRAYVYVLDRGNARVSVFGRDGRWVTDFFSKGEDDRSLAEPAALAVSGNNLVVSDPTRARILSFRLRPRLAPPALVSTKTVEGVVELAWPPVEDPWLARYRVYRATLPFGPYVEAGHSPVPAFRDAGAEAYATYFYRVGVESRPGEVGPLSSRVEVTVEGAFNRAPIEISTVTLGSIFPSRYKWYLKNPLGAVTVVNNLDVPFQNVSVAFRLKDYMDFPTETVLRVLEPRKAVEIPVLATLSNRILEVTEDTPVQGEVAVTYFERGEKKTVSRALPLRVYARNAITWEDPRRIAAFITERDTPVSDLGAEILRRAPDPEGPAAYLSAGVIKAAQLWSGLGAMGFKFLASPMNPFEKMVEDPAYPVDYMQLPRDTLRRRAGECDDLTTLLASLFEGVGVRSAVLDYPGHVAVMFDTGARDALAAGLPKELLIEYQGTQWVPLESTMIASPFDDAVRRAAAAYRQMAKSGKVKIIDRRDVADIYEPASPTSADTPAVPPAAEEIGRLASGPLGVLGRERLQFLLKHWSAAAAAHPEDGEVANRLGIVLAQQGRYGDAEKEFLRALQRSPGDAASLNNLGNLAFIRKSYDEAISRYEMAAQADPADAGVWLNLVRSAARLGRKEQGAAWGEKAVALDSELEAVVKTLLK